jgi:hypothetical protein
MACSLSNIFKRCFNASWTGEDRPYKGGEEVFSVKESSVGRGGIRRTRGEREGIYLLAVSSDDEVVCLFKKENCTTMQGPSRGQSVGLDIVQDAARPEGVKAPDTEGGPHDLSLFSIYSESSDDGSS